MKKVLKFETNFNVSIKVVLKNGFSDFISRRELKNVKRRIGLWKKYIKSFLHRGLIFGGFGPIIVGIVFLNISIFDKVSVTGTEFFIVIFSTYLTK